MKIFIRGLLAPAIGFTLARDWKSARNKTAGYEGAATLESLAFRVESLKTPERLPHDERITQVVNAFRESMGTIESTKPIHVLDIGGSFGEYFFRLQALIPERTFHWTVLETEGHCSIIPEILKSTTNLFLLIP